MRSLLVLFFDVAKKKRNSFTGVTYNECLLEARLNRSRFNRAPESMGGRWWRRFKNDGFAGIT